MYILFLPKREAVSRVFSPDSTEHCHIVPVLVREGSCVPSCSLVSFFLICRFWCIISRHFGGLLFWIFCCIVLFFFFRDSNYMTVIPSLFYILLSYWFYFLYLIFILLVIWQPLCNTFLFEYILHLATSNFSLHLWDNCHFLFFLS